MQLLPAEILSDARSEKMKKLELQFREIILGSKIGERIECPSCHYVGKNKRGTAVIFENSIKCFSCGMWRRI